MNDPLGALEGGLVVSVQAPAGSPLVPTTHIVAIARAAEAGGAVGLRAEGAADVAALKAALALPVIGLKKRRAPGSDVYITPQLHDARELAGAGADLIALDATARPRPGGERVAELIAAIAGQLERPVLADVDSLEVAVAARRAGAAAVATTLAGYTGANSAPAEPDLELVSRLAAELDCPVLAEGRYASPESVREALGRGAHAVVVGSAISDPLALTRSFAAATRRPGDPPR